MSFKNLPDIQFCETDTANVEDSVVKVYEALTEATLYPGDPVRLFLESLAAIIVQQRSVIDYASKQNLLSLADNEFLDHLGAFTGTKRLGAAAATATMRFAINDGLGFAVPIAKGTRVTPDGQLFFETVDYAEIAKDAGFADVTVRCQVAGSVGNGFLPGQIDKLVDANTNGHIVSVSNINASTGGADPEEKEAYRSRIQTAPESFSVAGPTGAYAHWAKSANASITDVSVYRTSPLDDLTEEQLDAILNMLNAQGIDELTAEQKKIELSTRLSSAVVNVCPLVEDPGLGTAALLEQVQSALNDRSIRPLTDLVRVAAPVEASYDIELTYYVSSQHAVTAAETRQAITQAVNDYIAWQKEILGRDITPDNLTALIIAAGAKRIELKSPGFQVVKVNEVARVKNLNITYGGLEDG
ncbi:MAG: baseplate J/gp47 family protein [Desulfobacteraceae bacterium]|nr:baseplate J/gp47 family protein [Desulfobacteraceae bacterium]